MMEIIAAFVAILILIASVVMLYAAFRIIKTSTRYSEDREKALFDLVRIKQRLEERRRKEHDSGSGS